MQEQKTQPEKKNFPYKTGDGSYNRESGNKTLLFVGACITLIVILSILSFFMIFQHARVLIR